MTPIPHETPRELHPSLLRLSELCDLVGYHQFVGRRTRWGEKLGQTPWEWTREYFEKYGECSPDEAIQLFREVGGEDDVTALFWVAVSLPLIP